MNIPAPALGLCQGSHGLLATSTMMQAVAESDIIWQVKLRKGKDHPQHLGNKEHDDKGKTVGTLLHLTQPVHRTGRLVVLDSGYCILQGLVELEKVEVFTHALIKKQ